MALEKGALRADISTRESSPVLAAGKTSEASEASLVNEAAENHDESVSIDNHVSNFTRLAGMAQSPAVPPNVQPLLESLFASLEKFQKLQQECITEISSILQGSPASHVVRNYLPDTIIPRMRTVGWEDFHRSHAGSEAQYTIDILGESTTSSISETVALYGFRVPERIRVNSARVIYTIKNKFFATHVEDSSPVTRPLIILRPFKRLVYDEQHMKALIGELEAQLDKGTKIESTEDFANFMQRFTRLQDHIKFLNLSCFEEFHFYVKELRCLLDFMDERVEPSRKRLRTETDIVSFSELWFLYPEGTYIFIKSVGSAQRVWRIIQRTGGRRPMTSVVSKQERPSVHNLTNFVIDCYFIDYNGSRFFPVYGRFEIEAFEGRKAVASLPVVPIRIAAKEGLLQEEAVIQRSRLFIQYCTKTSHLYYNGWSHHREPNGKSLRSHSNTKIDSEVIIDFERAVAEDPSLVEHETDPSVYRISDGELSGVDLEIDNDSHWDQYSSDELCGNIQVPDNDGNLAGHGECMPIFPDRVFGYVLKTRTWASLRIEALMAIQPGADSWDRLHLPGGHKDMIRSLVSAHFERNHDNTGTQESLDLIQGKGQGLILLLHGEPGTGKTSTAECVAATTSRPLLKINCGDIGIAPDQVERTLDNMFGLAHAWGCVLLLDEADVLLAKRSKSELARNALVSVFLRMIEYYTGLLFLTTNRMRAFDPAFASRIHVSLYYPRINEEITLKIWRNNIDRVSRSRPDIKMDEHALIAYAAKLYEAQCHQYTRIPWNGRQVTNAFQSALSLATFSAPSDGRPELTTAHFNQISEQSQLFDAYLKLPPSTRYYDTQRQSRNNLRPGTSAISLGPGSSIESLSPSDHSQSDDSSDSESPVFQPGHSSKLHKPPALQPGLPAASTQLHEQHQLPRNQAFSSASPPHVNPYLWPPHTQQHFTMPTGIPYNIQTQQPWPVPMPPVPQQPSQFPVPSTAPYMTAFNPFQHYQGHLHTDTQAMPAQTTQQQWHRNNVSNSGTTVTLPFFDRTAP
ncbi:hypothetical protein KVR01_011580 [Diaporthe batatas]|uniref:uncharacterized protein n=1 Tax=Diaporthe batatas TaxID=748121 RepID=UPI001D04DFAC|nr:uncharacterized protein KVR01_011580 [Diaporthe batatas]KAG8158458.1 hypothetical protein KVR01_011580 [Diaporthe batatas]